MNAFFELFCTYVTECSSTPKQTDYRGTVSITKTGKTCQKWSVSSPHQTQHEYNGKTVSDYTEHGLGDHNYCRNPYDDNVDEKVWCYTTDPESNWEFCKIPMCPGLCS